MKTSLWYKFQAAVRYVLRDDFAAIATIRAADSTQAPAEAQGQTATFPSAQPQGNDDGVEIAGIATINAIVEFAGTGTGTASVRVHWGKRDGNGAVQWSEGPDLTVELEDARGGVRRVSLEPLSPEGYDRVAFVVLSSSEVVGKIAVFPTTPTTPPYTITEPQINGAS